jgi:hypothetical protein
MVTLSSRNDSTIDLATGLGPIGVHHSQPDALSHPQGNHSALTVVAARILALQRGRLEDLCRELEVKSALSQISVALASIPAEAHSDKYTLVYTGVAICPAGYVPNEPRAAAA